MKLNLKYLFLTLTVTSFHTVFANPTSNSGDSSVDKMLQEFDSNSKAFMDKLPAKISLKPRKKLFSAESIKNKSFIESKNSLRPTAGRSEYLPNDNAKKIVDNATSMVVTLQEMENKKLTEAHLPSQPWSDSYWPLYEGNIAWRYGDTKFPGSTDFILNYNYVWLGPVIALGDSSPEKYDVLSPAEKYDLLIGDSNRTLTQTALNTGKVYYDKNKKVEDWMGICHGWSPASYMVPRPQKTVTVLAVDGKTKINFYPTDIKALSSFLWANSNFKTKFIGGRCNVKDPKKDSVGRVVDQSCFDTNPATWHLAVVNQIGVSQRGMVLDATYDYEVWNQPIYSYKYTYFNPTTRKAVNTLEEATVAVKDLQGDKFASYRDKHTDSIVGISMQMTYIAETDPTQAVTDTEDSDAKTTVNYLYDLELDEKGTIIGGEWYQNDHPDFLWTPAKGIRLLSPFDKALEKSKLVWDGKDAFPQAWEEYAKRNSQEGQVPLAKVIEVLLSLANAQQ